MCGKEMTREEWEADRARLDADFRDALRLARAPILRPRHSFLAYARAEAAAPVVHGAAQSPPPKPRKYRWRKRTEAKHARKTYRMALRMKVCPRPFQLREQP